MAYVGICSTYNEGGLAQGAVECLLEFCSWVQVCEGPVRGLEFEGPATELAAVRRLKGVDVWEGSFATEYEKRNAMLARAKAKRYPPGPVWLVYLDGDELLLFGRWVPDLIEAATGAAPEGEEPGAIPLPITEVDGSVGKVYRIFRADVLERHVLSMSQFLMRGSSAVVTLPLIPVWRPGEPVTATARAPLPGEPQIHHRAYYRPARSERVRLHAAEVSDFKELERAAGFAGAGGFEREAEGFGPIEMTVDEQAILADLQRRR